MATSSINITLRPVKFAFLVDPRKVGALLEAIQVSTFLWGGRFCPIVPVISRVPRIWQKADWFSRLNAREISAGYIDAYDPDFLVSVQGATLPSSTLTDAGIVDQRETITIDDIMGDVEAEGVPKYGVGLFELINDFYEKELKFTRRHPVTVSFPRFAPKYELFLASVTGSVPPKVDAILRKNHAPHLDAVEPVVDIHNYLDSFGPRIFHPRRITSLYVEYSQPSAVRGERCIFLVDAANALDIIDYWNLRAAGWDVLPIAVQTANEEISLKRSKEFVKASFRPSRHNPRVVYQATVMKARGVSAEALEAFASKIAADASNESTFSISEHYPRIWDAWARDKDGVDRCQIWSAEDEQEVLDDKGRFSVKKLVPRFGARSHSGHPRFVNELQVHCFGEKEPVAEIIPQGSDSLAKVIRGVGLGDWRTSKEGMAYLADSWRGRVSFALPNAEGLFIEWMKARGLEVKLSAAGKVAKQILRHLGGVFGLSLLSHPKIIEMVGYIAGGKVLPKGDLERRLHQIVSDRRIGFRDKAQLRKQLVDKGILAVGAHIRCTTCSQSTWYSIKELDYELQCLNCSDKFALPETTAVGLDWAYRANALFDLPKKAYGSYSVLLAHRFFAGLLRGSSTPIFSFEYVDPKGKQHEVDYGLFFRYNRFGRSEPDVIFVECKDLGQEFSRKDIEAMRSLALLFPGAILAFATLRDALTDREKKLLRPFVNKGRRYWKAEKAYNPVLILTGIELFSDWEPIRAWKDAGGNYATFSARVQYIRGLHQLCDLTQQLHLGMQPWHEWLRERQDRRMAKGSNNVRPAHPPNPER